MARDDWYRCTEWTAQERATFDEKIRRSRQPWSRWQYFRIQAGALRWHGRSPDARAEAKRLLERSLAEVKNIEPDWAAASHEALGDLLLEEGDDRGAEEHLRASIAILPIAQRRIRSELIAEERLATLLMRDPAREDEARALFQAAWADRRWPPPYPALAVQEVLDLDGAPQRDPEAAAEALVVYHHGSDGGLDPAAIDALFAADPRLLPALDRLFRAQPPRRVYSREFLARYLPELGAYLGRILVRAGGSWSAREPLMQTRVLQSGREIDPFAIAYDAIWYDVPLARSWERLARGSAGYDPRASQESR